MAREVHSKEIDEDQPGCCRSGQQLRSRLPRRSRQENQDRRVASWRPISCCPPPPSGRLAASIQRMPPAGRWALGLALAFLSIFMGWVPGPGGYAVMSVLVLAAGFVLGSWRAMLPAAIAAAAGAFAEFGVAVQLVPLIIGARTHQMGRCRAHFGVYCDVRDHTVLLFAGRRKHEQMCGCKLLPPIKSW